MAYVHGPSATSPPAYGADVTSWGPPPTYKEQDGSSQGAPPDPPEGVMPGLCTPGSDRDTIPIVETQGTVHTGGFREVPVVLQRTRPMPSRLRTRGSCCAIFLCVKVIILGTAVGVYMGTHHYTSSYGTDGYVYDPKIDHNYDYNNYQPDPIKKPEEKFYLNLRRGEKNIPGDTAGVIWKVIIPFSSTRSCSQRGVLALHPPAFKTALNISLTFDSSVSGVTFQIIRPLKYHEDIAMRSKYIADRTISNLLVNEDILNKVFPQDKGRLALHLHISDHRLLVSGAVNATLSGTDLFDFGTMYLGINRGVYPSFSSSAQEIGTGLCSMELKWL